MGVARKNQPAHAARVRSGRKSLPRKGQPRTVFFRDDQIKRMNDIVDAMGTSISAFARIAVDEKLAGLDNQPK